MIGPAHGTGFTRESVGQGGRAALGGPERLADRDAEACLEPSRHGRRQRGTGGDGQSDATEIRRLAKRFDLAPAAEPRGSAPAELWRVAPDDRQPGGLLGVIPTVTGPFCAACDRTRITADGQIRTCLFSRTETDLRTPLRHGASDLELAELWAGAQGLKAPAHGIGEPGFVQPTRTMSAIGG